VLVRELGHIATGNVLDEAREELLGPARNCFLPISTLRPTRRTRYKRLAAAAAAPASLTVVEVGKSLVVLDGRELGVVSHLRFHPAVSNLVRSVGTIIARALTVDPLIPELLANLKHPVQPANDEHLEVQLRRNAHEHLHVQVVVVRLEGLGRRAARNGVEDGRLDLDEVVVLEVAADVRDDAKGEAQRD
jgi:hypothetical protein